MASRELEIGGEVLRPGSVVVVFDGNFYRERVVLSIGTRRIQIEGNGDTPVPYSIETRKSQSGAYASYFRTVTEIAEQHEREALMTELRDLGVQARVAGYGTTGLDGYPNQALTEVVAVLKKYRNTSE